MPFSSVPQRFQHVLDRMHEARVHRTGIPSLLALSRDTRLIAHVSVFVVQFSTFSRFAFSYFVSFLSCSQRVELHWLTLLLSDSSTVIYKKGCTIFYFDMVSFS